MNELQPNYKGHYGPHWLLLFLLIGVPLAYRWTHNTSQLLFRAPETTRATGTGEISDGVDWFLLLRMPAITNQYESGVSIMQVRYGLWLDALLQAGFHPMKLSDVYDRLRRHEKIPEKTVVLAFDPGYRRTFRLIAPIFQQRDCPAVWLTNESAMQRGHREYVTYHATREMIQSGWWDVGFLKPDGSMRLQSRNHGEFNFGDRRHPVWSVVAGGIALNRGGVASSLNRLNVNADWTDQDLLNRVRAELPAEHKIFLAKAPVQNLTWGVTTENEAEPDARFDLQVASHKRGLVLDWFGTQGIPDAQIHADASSLVGDFTLRLRWDEEKGNGISILISHDQLFIQEMSGGHVKSVFRLDRGETGQDGHFRIDLTLQDDDLAIALDGRAPAHMPQHVHSEPGRGLLQIFLVDRVRGAARAKSVQVSFTPLKGDHAVQ